MTITTALKCSGAVVSNGLSNHIEHLSQLGQLNDGKYQHRQRTLMLGNILFQSSDHCRPQVDAGVSPKATLGLKFIE